MRIHKMILTDENMRPVAVQIESAISGKTKKRSRIAHMSGTIKLSEDPLKYQHRMRNEWQ